jgi:hypothetical protein
MDHCLAVRAMTLFGQQDRHATPEPEHLSLKAGEPGGEVLQVAFHELKLFAEPAVLKLQLPETALQTSLCVHEETPCDG